MHAILIYPYATFIKAKIFSQVKILKKLWFYWWRLHISFKLKLLWSACSICLQHLNLERLCRKLISEQDVSRKRFKGSGGTWTRVSELQVCNSINSATRLDTYLEVLFNRSFQAFTWFFEKSACSWLMHFLISNRFEICTS